MSEQNQGGELNEDSRQLLKRIMYEKINVLMSQQDRGEELDEDLKMLLKRIIY